MIVVPPPRIIVLSSDAFTETRCERMSAADPTPTVKSNATISDRLASFNRPSMFPSSAQPLGPGASVRRHWHVLLRFWHRGHRGEFRPDPSAHVNRLGSQAPRSMLTPWTLKWVMPTIGLSGTKVP